MKTDFLSRWYMVSVLFVIIIAILILARPLLVPLTLSFFLSLGLSPFVERLKKWRIPKGLSILIAYIIGFAVIGGIIYIIGFAVNNFIANVPGYTVSVNQNIGATKTLLMHQFSLTETQVNNSLGNYTNISNWGTGVAQRILHATTNAITTMVLTLVITFFLLLYHDRIKKFFEMIANKNHQEEIETVAHKSFKILPQYIIGLTSVMTIVAIVCSLGFWWIGVKSPLFWGIIVALMNVIPYVGIIIGFVGVIIFTLVTSGPTTALFALVMFIIVQISVNNILGPRIAGGKISVNSLSAILAIIIGGLIWGIVGMILALPILGLIKIICDTVPNLQPVGYLLGDKE